MPPAVAGAPAPLLVPQGRFSFQSYGPSQGLSDQSTWDIVQDAGGFIWVGSEFGLYRYDGYRFKGFYLADGLPSNYVSKLLLDSRGTLWAGTYGGLARFDGAGFKAPEADPALLQVQIYALAEDRGGRLWAGTSNGPFAMMDGRRFTAFHGWTAGGITALAAGPSSPWVWLASQAEGRSRLFSWDGKAFGEFSLPRLLVEDRIDSMVVDGAGTLWIRTLARLWSLAKGQTQLVVHKEVPPCVQLGSLRVDGQGRALVPAMTNVYRREGQGWLALGTGTGLGQGTVRNVFEDREGSLWLCSDGVKRLQGRGLWRVYSVEEGLPHEMVWCMRRDRAGHLLVGTDRGLAVSSRDRFHAVEGLAGVQIRSLVEAPDGTWFGAGSPVIFRWDPRTNQVKRFGPEAGVICQGRIFRLLMDSRGTLWAGTDGGGLLRGEGQGDALRFHRVLVPGGTRQERFRDLMEDGQGRLWAAGDQGVAVLDQGVWKRFTKADGLRDTHVAYLCRRASGEVDAAYFELPAIVRMRYEQGALRVLGHLEEPAGRLSSKVYILAEDDRGRLWVGNSRGLDVFRPDGGLEHFGKEDGLAGEDMSAQSFFQEPGGAIWVGSSRGLSRFDAGALPKAEAPPQAIVIQARFGDQEVGLLGPMPRIPHLRNTFQVQFSTLSFAQEGAVQHQVRILGLDEVWRTPEGRSQIYPGLPPGTFLFQVQSRIGTGAWGPPAALRFEILPAWWQRAWAKGVLLLGLICLVGALFQGRMVRLRRRNQLLEGMVEVRTRQVQDKARELERANAALLDQSLTDPLTGAHNRRYLGQCLPQDVARVRRAYDDLHFGRTTRILDNLDLQFIMVDLDWFKSVNDLHGHAAGDLVLQDCAALLRQCLRETDSLTRWGGEEFLIVARNTNQPMAAQVAERIRSAVAAHDFLLENGTVLRRTVSLGFAFFPFTASQPDLFDWQKIIDLADLAMYAAKRGGRNAWIGLVAAPGADPAHLQAGIPHGLEALLEAGQVQILTSLPPDTVFHWDEAKVG